jgi:GH25 family lysozyme M1 (1,4-beta-N-acetylmuramidase)
MYKGYDISIIQGDVDFQAAAASGISFIICRAVVGNGGIDKNYYTNIKNAKAAGIKVMAYNFVYPLPPMTSQPLRDPLKQAQYHFESCQGELAACDLEWPAADSWSKWGCSAKQINDWALTYLAEYSRLDGRKMVLYTYPYFVKAVQFSQDFAQYPLWIASYQAKPAVPHPWTDWTLWQNSGGTEKLPNGVPVDTDLAKDLSLWDPTQIATPPAAPDQVITAPSTVASPPPQPVLAPTDPMSSFFNTIKNTISNLIKK